MVRKLLKSLLSLSLIVPLGAHALGLGDITLHSALSERLKADISLLSVKPAEAESMTVSLASQEAFDKVGLERPAILMYLQFEVVEENGDYSIKVSSKEPIGEPFLDFLVAVEWKSGRVMREYTVLLDPPTGHKDAAPSVSTPSSSQPASMPATAGSSMPSGMTSSRTAAPAQAMTGQAAPSAVASGVSPSMDSGSIVYGPVKANDTLWRIADKLRPNGVSVHQMMIALVKANPYAFFENNINRLKRGFVLRIDDPAMLTAMNKAEAVREVARQNRAWHDYREKVASRAAKRPAAGTASEAEPGAAVATKSEPKLTLVAPEGKAADSAKPSGSVEGKGDESASEELMLALENSAAQRKENDALKSRVEALEGQLQDMEQIVSLKDADLAALQKQLREQGKTVEMPSEQKPADEIVKAEAEKAAADLVVKPGEEEAAAEEKAEAMPADMAAKTEETTAAAAEKPAVEKKAEATPAKPKPVAKPKPKPRKPVSMPPRQEPTLTEQLLNDPMIMGVGAGTLILVLLLIGLIIRRRRKSGFQESILNGGPSSLMKANDEQGSETSFLSDLAISGMGPGTIQTDEGEVDPLTEADVFMAYGRNQQAEEVLKKAHDQSPDRADVSAKLLEVYYNTKDKEQFEALAEKTASSLQANEDIWNKVLAMGYELCPDNVLFEAGAGSTPPAAPAETSEPSGDAVMDIGLDLDELSAEMESEGGGDMDLDLGLDFSDLDQEPAAEAEKPSEEADSFDFDISTEDDSAKEAADFDLDLGTEELSEPVKEESPADEGSLDFDLDLGADEEAAESASSDLDMELGDLATDTEEPVSSDDMSLDFDLGGLGEEPSSEEPADVGLDMSDLSLDDLESSLDAESSTSDTGTADAGGLDLDMDLGDLDDLGSLDDLEGAEDEMSTKLDLAQAYVEMGDSEGARSMLEEVVASGSDEQKQQAQSLIDKL